MEDEKKVEESTEEESQEGETPQENLVVRAEQAALALKAENDRKESIIQADAVNRALSGESDAGQAPPQKLEETPKEYKDRIMRGGI